MQNTDFVFTEFRATLHGVKAWSGWIIAPYLGILHQGEQQINQPFVPDRASDEILPIVRTGVVEKTIRSGLSIRYTRSKHVWIHTDFGVNQVRNQDHQPGVEDLHFVGSLRLGIELDALLNGRATR